MALFFVVAFVIAALCVLAVYHQSPEPREKFRTGNFDRTVAEGMRLWNPKAGVDSVRFDACRIEKMRMGAFALGGFNVLCLDGLVLNLPLDAEASGVKSEECKVKSGEEKRSSDRFRAVDAFAGLLPRSFLQRAGVPARSFSGIRVRGLAVNRIENRREVPVFAADEAKNRGRTLELRNCRVFAEDGSTNLVGVARLMLQPAPALVWQGGMRKLDDLLPNSSGGETHHSSDRFAAASQVDIPPRGEVSLRGGAVSAAPNEDLATPKGKDK